MKQLILFIFLIPGTAKGQDITGNWNGILKVQGMELRLVFHVSEEGSTYQVSMDSPDQGAFGILASSVEFDDTTLNIIIDKLGARYQRGYIAGTFYQAGQSSELKLTSEQVEKKIIHRPQEPKEPYSNSSEEIIQQEVSMRRNIFKLFYKYNEPDLFETKLREYLNDIMSENEFAVEAIDKEEFIKMQISNFRKPRIKYFLNYDHANSLKMIKCPVLALNGGKDVQVAPENLIAIEKAIRQKGENVTTKEFPNMNHLFQKCETGAIEEYASIEQTMAPVVLEEISNWVIKQVK